MKGEEGNVLLGMLHVPMHVFPSPPTRHLLGAGGTPGTPGKFPAEITAILSSSGSLSPPVHSQHSQMGSGPATPGDAPGSHQGSAPTALPAPALGKSKDGDYCPASEAVPQLLPGWKTGKGDTF